MDGRFLRGRKRGTEGARKRDGRPKKKPQRKRAGARGAAPEAVRPRGRFAWFRGSRSEVPAESLG